MPTDTDNVVAFPGIRVAHEPATLIIGAALSMEPVSVTRTFGVNDSLTMHELGDALCRLFGWSTRDAAPQRFLVDGTVVPPDWRVGEVLTEPKDCLTWTWGLWEHNLEVREAFARDEATPDVLCIGGSGSVDGADALGGTGEVDIAAINADLTGEDTMARTLSGAHEEVSELIERCGAVEFVPLLQALDLRRETCVGPTESAFMRSLPGESAEDNAAGRDAAWVTLLCAAALVDDDVRHDIATHTMDRLMWCREDGFPLSGEDIDELCADTLGALQDVGALGDNPQPTDIRLDLLRESLRR